MIETHQTKLDTIKHLIIDLRGNTGGGDDTYNNVIPFIYTNPIITHGAFLWTSENNISLFEQYVDNPNLPEDTRQQIEKMIKKGKAYPNTFTLFSESETDTLKLEVKKNFPKKLVFSLTVNV